MRVDAANEDDDDDDGGSGLVDFFLVSHIIFFLYQFPLPQYIPANIPYHAIRCHSRSLFKSLNDISDF